jgi:hypothetical protein
MPVSTRSMSSPSSSSSSSSTATAPPSKKLFGIMKKAGKRALGGGLPGFLAMLVQVAALMWMRTLVNYQYSKGGSFAEAFAALYAEGGLGRFYNGFSFAIVVGPLGRFGDTAANEGILAVMADLFPAVPVAVATMLASAGAAAWRVATQPIQNMKTLMQVEGADKAFGVMASKMADMGAASALWDGAAGTMGATWMGHYPWFATNNFLRTAWPESPDAGKAAKLLRNALIGFCSSMVSDCVANPLRAITTKKQTMANATGYLAVTQLIIAEKGGGVEGVLGLMGRGLATKIISNGIQVGERERCLCLAVT